MATNVMCGTVVTGVWKDVYGQNARMIMKMIDVLRDFRAALNGFIVKCDDYIVIFIFKPFVTTYIYVVCGKVMFSANACLFTGGGQSPCYRSYGVTRSKPQPPTMWEPPGPAPLPTKLGPRDLLKLFGLGTAPPRPVGTQQPLQSAL